MFLLTFRKTRKRDKLESIASSSNLNTTNTQLSSSPTSPNIVLSNTEDTSSQAHLQLNTNKTTKFNKNPKKFFNKNYSSTNNSNNNSSQNNSANIEQNSINESKSLNNINSSEGCCNTSNTKSFFKLNSNNANTDSKKSSTLPLDKTSVINNSDLDNSITYSSNSTASSSSSNTSSSSIINNIMITTSAASGNNLNSSLLSPMEVLNNNSNNNLTATIVQQPQSISNTIMSSTLTQLPSTPITNNSVNSNSSNNSNNQSNSKTTNSLSYLDESNLKMAVIEYSDIVKLIKLQNLIDYHEWLAFNTKMYFDQINVLYGAISDHCTPQTCPTMNGPANTQFYWLDEKGRKIKYPASQYIDTVLTYIAKTVSDEAVFPTKVGHPFPQNFEAIVKKIHKHLFQILVHMYNSHYKELVQLKLNTYVNSIYLHIYSFNKSFNTLEDKDVEIMDALNKCLINKYIDPSNAAQQQALMQNQQPPTIHQSSNSSSSSGVGFSFFKKKLNFNLMA